MKTHFTVAGMLILCGFVSTISPVSAQSKAESGLSFTTGNTHFEARQQQPDGLLRDVTVTETNPKASISSVIYAKFARQDPQKPKRWILGQVVVHQFGSDKTHLSQMKAKQLTIDFNKPKPN